MSLETAANAPLEYVGAFEQFTPIDIRESDGLKLAEAPIHVLKAQIDEDTIEYHAVFEHEAFRGRTFLNLLTTASPDQSGFTSGVLGDWVLPDRAVDRGPGAEFNNSLLNDHVRGLGQHWADFEASRHLFMRALADGQYDVFEHTEVNTLRVKFLGHEEVEDAFREACLDMDFYQGRRVYGTEELPDFTETVAGYMLQDGLLEPRDIKRIADGKTRKAATAIYKKNQEKYGRRYFAELSDEQQATALEVYKGLNYHPITVASGEERFIANRKDISSPEIAEAFTRRRSIPIKGTRSDIDYTYVDTSAGRRRIIFLDTLREGPRDVAIQPVLSWQTTRTSDGTDRRLIVDSYEVDLTDPSKRIYADVIGGLLCLAYLSPELRQDKKLWPQARTIPGRPNPQELGAAQVPVLALMRREQLLGSALINSLEDFAA